MRATGKQGRRSQIKSDTFKYLFEKFTTIYNNKPRLFKGYRIFACDGSDISIAHNPNDEETYFPHGGAKGFNQLHLNAMYDLPDRIYTDIIIQPAENENGLKAFWDMADRYVGSEKFDTDLSLILTRKWTKDVLDHPEIYRRFHDKDSFEFLDLDEHAYYNMNLRVLRFPISETGHECVITNLPTDGFSAEEIKKLYSWKHRERLPRRRLFAF